MKQLSAQKNKTELRVGGLGRDILITLESGVKKVDRLPAKVVAMITRRKILDGEGLDDECMFC